MHKAPWIKVSTLFLAVIIFDRITKNLVVSKIAYRELIRIYGNFFRLTYVLNPGGAFGTRLGGNYFYIGAALVAAIILVFWLFRHKHSTLGLAGIALMLGGAVGNIWDRCTIGKVIDFLDFGVNNTRWATFNIADSAITIGICFLVLQEIIEMFGSRNEAVIKKTADEEIVENTGCGI